MIAGQGALPARLEVHRYPGVAMTSTDALQNQTLPPGPPPRPGGILPTLRYYLNFARGPFRFIQQRFDRYGDIYCARNPDGALYVLRHPEHFREVLLTRADDFSKQHTAFESLTRVLGDALLTSDGETWKRQRRLVQPAFTRKQMGAYADMMVTETVAMCDQWRPGTKMDMGREMVNLTLRIVCRTLFSYRIDGQTDKVARAMRTLNDSTASLNLLPEWLPTPKRSRINRAIALLDDIIYGIIEQRQNAGSDEAHDDLLQRLLTAVDSENPGSRLSPEEIRNQLMTLFLAGHETTSHALTWTWYLLARNPEVEAKLHQELDEVLAGRTPGYEDLANLPYTEQVIKEAMRLYPPAYVLARRARRDTEVAGYEVPEGSELVLWLYMTHHDERWFPEPEAFKPERFDPDAKTDIPRLAWMPFGGGPRTCIGAEFAMVEARLILAILAQRFRPRLVSNEPVEPGPAITLTPKSRVRMRLEAR
jgi:cytochrome P450